MEAVVANETRTCVAEQVGLRWLECQALGLGTSSVVQSLPVTLALKGLPPMW